MNTWGKLGPQTGKGTTKEKKTVENNNRRGNILIKSADF